MLVYNIIFFVLGILLCIVTGCLAANLNKPKKKIYRNKSSTKLDDVDQMVLWGEVNDDAFFKP